MALFDRLQANSIEGVPPEPSRAGEPLHSAKTGRTGDARAPAYTSEPEAIARTYYVEDRGSERRYYDDYQRKALAIRANADSISTRREDLNTVRAMLEMAAARGWSEIKINGTAEFRREMWIEAQARGLAAQGYKPSDLDRQEADRRRAERGQDTSRATRPNGPPNEVRQNTPTGAGQQEVAAAQSPKQATSERMPKQEPLHSAKPTQPPTSPAATKPAQTETAYSPAFVDHMRAVHEALTQLSPDGRLVMQAMSDKIDRQMNRLNSEAKAQLKAFAGAELLKKERAEGPVVLSPEQRQVAISPPPPVRKPGPPPEPRRTEPEPPRRSLSR